MLEDGDAGCRGRVRQQSLGDLAAGGVAAVQDAAFRVAAFAAEVEASPPFVRGRSSTPQSHQFVDGGGALADDGAHRLLVAEPGPGIEGVGDVLVDRVAGVAQFGQTEAMPPCAQAVLGSRASPLVITATEPWRRRDGEGQAGDAGSQLPRKSNSQHLGKGSVQIPTTNNFSGSARDIQVVDEPSLAEEYGGRRGGV